MRKLVIRTAMIGGGVSYYVYVPVEDVNNYEPIRYTTIIMNGKKFIDYTNTRLNEIYCKALKEEGRYRTVIENRKRVEKEKLKIIQSVFPETKVLKEYPHLWVNDLLPPEQETNKEIWID